MSFSEASSVPRWVHDPLAGDLNFMGMSIQSEDLTLAHLEQALGGDALLLGAMIDRLTPVIQVRVARATLRRQSAANRPHFRQEVEDLIQDVLVSLFANNAKVLRNWDPEKGLSLANYVGLVAERLVSSILQSGKKTWPAELVATETLDRPATDRDPEQRAVARQALRRVLQLLEQDLSRQGFEMFKLIFVKELTVSEIRRQTGMSDDAIYAWRSRLRHRTRGMMQQSDLTWASGEGRP